MGMSTMMVARTMVAAFIGAQDFSSCQQMRVPFPNSSDAVPGPISIRFLSKLESKRGVGVAAVVLRENRVAALAVSKDKWNLREEEGEGGGEEEEISSADTLAPSSPRHTRATSNIGNWDTPVSINSFLEEEVEERWLKVQDNPLEGVTFTSADFENALAKYDYSCDVGDVVKGVVIKSDYGGALIDIGAKAPAYLPLYEACIHPLKNVEEVGLFPGTKEEYMILREDDDNGRVIVSLRELQKDIAWERCRQLQVDNVTIRAKPFAVNRGGVVIKVEGLPGFMPFSQMSKGYVVEELVDKEIPFKVLEASEEQMRLILSNKKAVAENQSSYAIGSVVEGTVQSVKPYGAFIDIGTVVGLLHISQISHDRLTSVEAVLAPGDKLKVMILSHDKERGRISFSTKKLEPTPGDMLRNPALVYEKAEETARMFTQRVPQSVAAVHPEQSRLNAEDWLNLRTEFSSSSKIVGTGRMS